MTTLSFALACVAALAGAGPAAAIVGGAPAPIAAFPYQVALVKSGSDVYDGQFCGGTIRDASHVITAAHCVFDNALTAPGQAIAPGVVDVVAGTDTLDAAAPGQRIPVDAAAVDPNYRSDNASNDAALLTLARPIALGPTAAALPILSTTEWSVTPPGTRAVVSGWGATTPPASPLLPGTDYPTQLQAADVPLVADATCAPAYSDLGFDPASSTCAGEPQGGVDACHGDSGGPLALEQTFPAAPPADRLIGIVSYGLGCGTAGYPGVYSEVAAPSLRAFVKTGDPGEAPANIVGPALTGAGAGPARVGETLTCAPGSWSDADQYLFEFARGTTPLTDLTARASYVVQAADLGSTIACHVRAQGPQGLGWAMSNGMAVGQGARSPGAPGQPNAPGSPSALDVNAPVARVTKASCTGSRCALRVRVTDVGFSAGIRRVRATVRSTYRAICRRGAERVACTRNVTRKAKVTRVRGTTFRVVASALRAGTHVFTIVAVDRAGHVQRLPTRRTLRTKRR